MTMVIRTKVPKSSLTTFHPSPIQRIVSLLAPVRTVKAAGAAATAAPPGPASMRCELPHLAQNAALDSTGEPQLWQNIVSSDGWNPPASQIILPTGYVKMQLMAIPNVRRFRITNPEGGQTATIMAVLPKGADVNAYLSDATKRFDWKAHTEA